LSAWNRVLEQASGSPAAHASAIVLASRLGDRDVLAEVLARAQATERSPWAVASLALRRARLFAGDEPQRSDAILRELGDQPPTADLDDPRRTALLVVAAARLKEPSDAAHALEDRAARIAAAGVSAPEAAALRLRAAQLALDAGDAGKATALLGQVERALPSLGVVPDLLAAARRRAGDRSVAAPYAPAAVPTAGASGDAYARLLRDADLAAAQDDAATALALYQRALELRPDDPLAVVPLIRVATQLRDGAALTQLALGRLRAAEAANDHVAKAEAYELLAHIDADLRDDTASAQIALENASQADPSRVDLVHRLERRYAKTDRLDELIRLRRGVVANLPDTVPHDRAALIVDLAALAARDQRTDAELAELYRTALVSEPGHRLALFHLESLVRRQGASPELADLEGRIAVFFGSGFGAGGTANGDPDHHTDRRGEAAFHTRAGETLAEIGRIPEAIEQFKLAVAALPGHAFALEGWRAAALKGERWADVAEAATQQAAVTTDAAARGALHHLAGVALMDKALDGEHAAVAFRRALEANPRNGDAFIRLRILLEEDGNHDDLATLLAQRLEVEPDARGKIELHRALAELHRNFLSDRDTAKRHYRAILAADPNDLRAHAAVADIAWEQGSWEEAADALVARARLEREPEVLKTLCYRLGLIYADRLVNVPKAIAAFQRALTYTPDDENTLVRLADLATSAGEWKLALGACERLVKAEQDPERRATHLQRVAKIFKNGFNDAKRAERALNLALDSAPTSDEALSALVAFYKDAGDMVSVRVHLNRVAGAMRARYEKDGRDGVACRVISRAMAARDHAGVVGSLAVARSAAELADLLGAGGEPERLLLTNADLARPEPARLIKAETDEVLFPRGVPPELRQIFQLLGDRVAKHVGVDLRPYGATRGDRLRARDSDVAATAQDIASQLGFGEIDVYVSTRQPFAMMAEPTSPVSFVVGQQIAAAGKLAVRFAAGAALKLAQASLAIPARLAASEAGTEELGVLVVALLRLFQPDFPAMSVDADAVTAQTHKLKRLIPTGLSNELRPFALAIDGQRFGHRELARDLRIAGLRAGLVASGSLTAGLGILATQAGLVGAGSLPQVLSDPAAAGLIAFALGEDHATVAR
jgi:tetratricopeptide (TPR) repeat protein